MRALAAFAVSAGCQGLCSEGALDTLQQQMLRSVHMQRRLHKSKSEVSALLCFRQRGLPWLPSCSQAEETAQRTAQVTQDARIWHMPANFPEAQRRSDCTEEHRGGGVGGK